MALVGIGDGDPVDIDTAAGLAGSLARDQAAATVAVDLKESFSSSQVVERFLEGNYRFDQYKAEKGRKAPTEALILVTEDDGSLQIAHAVSAGQYFARDLVNEPAAVIYPESMAERAQSLASDRMQVDIWDEARIRDAGMGGIIGVGQGSTRQIPGPRKSTIITATHLS